MYLYKHNLCQKFQGGKLYCLFLKEPEPVYLFNIRNFLDWGLIKFSQKNKSLQQLVSFVVF